MLERKKPVSMLRLKNLFSFIVLPSFIFLFALNFEARAYDGLTQSSISAVTSIPNLLLTIGVVMLVVVIFVSIIDGVRCSRQAKD
jgi:hypothetical protein